MWDEPTSPIFLGVIAASILAHVTVIALMPPAAEAAAPSQPPTPVLVVIEAVKSPPPPLPPPPPPVPVPASPALPPTVAARPTALRAPRPAVQRVATPTPTVTSELADFSGVTLTNDGAAWATPVGNGAPPATPIGTAPASTPHGHGTRVSAPAGDRVVALGDLSRPPRAPNLDAQLAANYPHDARAAGMSGSAVIKARILVDGRVGSTRVVSETSPGFGVACQHTLAGSRWQPPLDADKHAVATDLAYTCTFAVAR